MCPGGFAMPDRPSDTIADEARSLTAKLLTFKQSLAPHERALFAALMLHVQRESDTGDVAGFDGGEPNVLREVLASVMPAPYPGDPEWGAAIARN